MSAGVPTERPSREVTGEDVGRPGAPDDPAWTELLRGIVGIASEERSLLSVLRHTAQLLAGASGADACFVHVVDHERREVVLMGATPAEFNELVGTIRLPFGEGVSGWVAEQRRSVVLDDKWADPRYRYIPALRGEEYQSLVSVPLSRPQGTIVGVLNVHARAPRAFSTEVVERLEEVASLLAGIVEGALLHERLRMREEQLELFTARTIEMQELDRRRLASDIHDGISQRLVSAWYHVRAATSLTADDDVLAELAEVDALLSGALDEARSAIAGLRPAVLDDLGLTAAIHSLASNAGEFAVRLELSECRLPPHIETAVYRIAQEALQNVAKHASAASVELSLERRHGEVVLTIRDDGIGFDRAGVVSSARHGLSGMEERASLLGASLEVESRPGGGTAVVLRLPASSPG